VTGNSTYVNGLACIPSTPPALTVDVEPGQIYSLSETDSTDYGSIPTDLRLIMQQGILADAITSGTPAPITIGDSVKYLIEAAFQQADGVQVNRTFLAAPSQLVDTQRQGLVSIITKAGVPAPTGTELTPTPDAGYIGLWVITVAYGQTTVTAPDIAVYPSAPFITEKLQDKISQTTADNRYVKVPTLGAAAYFWRGTGTSTGITTSPTVINLTQASGPLAWISGNKFQPTFACVATLSVFLDIIFDAAQAQVYELVNSNGQYFAQSHELPGSGSGQINASGTFSFNGTSDYVEVFGRTGFSTGSGTIVNFSAVIIAN